FCAAGWLPVSAQTHAAPVGRGKEAPPPEPPGTTADPAKLFAQGEQLSYAIYWGPFEVGHADWYVWPARNAKGENILRSVLNVRTNASTDLFYRIRANSSSWATSALDRSLQYSAQQDDLYRSRHAQLTFDSKNNLVNEKMTVTAAPGAPPMRQRPPPPPNGAVASSNTTARGPRDNRGNPAFAPVPPSPWPVSGAAFDPLAALLYYRTLPLQVNLAQHACVCDTRGVHDVTVRVLGLEKISQPGGLVYAWVVEPDLPGSGLFMRGANSPIRFWIAADGSRRPLRFSGSIGIGSFHAELVSSAPYAPPAPEGKKPVESGPPVAVTNVSSTPQ
ncbi:MAG: DUF3108 domain-containing protein, partial [Opitutales bacterium]